MEISNMKQKLVLIASVVIGLLAALLTRSYLNEKDREVEKWKADFKKRNETIGVVVAKKALPSGTKLTWADIGGDDAIERQVRGRVVLEKDAIALIGRELSHSIEEKQIIGWADIKDGDLLSRRLAETLANGRRAISVNVNGAAAVSGMVTPNDHVDVLGTFSFPSKKVPGEMELVTLTILQNVLVLATGKETANARALGEKTSGGNYSTVTLEVTPREAEMLVFSEQIKGRIFLALRNPADVYTESELPRVNFDKIQETIGQLNEIRQKSKMSTTRR
jgi:pilus assembly protein CpaB